MTAPRRVPTEVERTARHVHLGPLATVIARLGVALEESRREVQRLHADNDQLRQQIKGGYIPGGSGSSETQQAIADILAANEQHIVPRDPNRPPLHWRDITGLPEPRRRWWHRLTRALAGRWRHVLTPGFLGELSNDIWSHMRHRLTRRNP